MALYTYGGTPADVLTDTAGNVIGDYPVLIRMAGTGELVTALYEADGTTPIGELRTNPATSSQPGAIRTFKADGPTAIEYEYLDASSNPVRWYQSAREVAQEALAASADALSRTEGGTVTGTLAAAAGLTVTGGTTTDDLVVTGTMSIGGTPFDPDTAGLTALRIYNPREYGALGDGVNDDAPAIQAALGDAYDAGGGQVLVPPGDYRLVTLPLRIYRNTRLTLMRGARFIRAADLTVLTNGDSGQELGGYTGHGGIVIEGGVWEMQGTTPGLTGSRMCISLGHARAVTIRDIEVRDVPGYHAIEINSTQTARITDCKFLGFADPGGREFSEAIQLDLAKASSVFGAFGPYDNTPCDDVTIRGCTFGPSGSADTTSWPRGVGSHSATIDRWHTNVRVIGNHFQDCPQYAMTAYSYQDCVFSGNTVVGCGAGFRAQPPNSSNPDATTDANGVQTNASQDCRGFTVTGNTFRNMGSHDPAIYLQGEATGRIMVATVTGNTIDGSSTMGIKADYAREYTIGPNTLYDAGSTGISQANCGAATVIGNRLYSPAYNGITADACDDLQIGTNTIRDAGNNGIHVVGGADLRIQNNSIKGAATVNASQWGIRISSGADDILLTGNRVRAATGSAMANGLGVTNTVTNLRRYGNDYKGSATTEINDASVTPVLSPYDDTTTP